MLTNGERARAAHSSGRRIAASVSHCRTCVVAAADAVLDLCVLGGEGGDGAHELLLWLRAAEAPAHAVAQVVQRVDRRRHCGEEQHSEAEAKHGDARVPRRCV